MTSRGPAIRIPIWVRIPGFIALVLVAVVLGTTLLGAAGAGSDGRGGGMDHNGDQTGDHTPTDGHTPLGGRGH